MDQPISIGMFIYPQMTQLDFTAPFEVFARMQHSIVHVIAYSANPVRSDTGLSILPTTTLKECPPLDILFVPGGPGHISLIEDQAALQFLRSRAHDARLVTSVCTGSLILAAAGLLHGYRATTHWSCMEDLERFGASPQNDRVVVDGNRITGAGVTAGLDFALTVAAAFRGNQEAKTIQLLLEYDPQPPFDSGSPQKAGVELTNEILARNPQHKIKRSEAIERAARRIAPPSHDP